MKIAILGTRGIPNTYGGFEQCAEIISTYFANNGHQITVYNPTDHPFHEDNYNGSQIKRIFSNENLLSFLNVFIFDYLCLKDAIKCNYDVIIELGYHPVSIYFSIASGSNVKIITNVAGMEWKRSKWNGVTQKFIKYCEKQAVLKSDALIVDNKGIQEYFSKKYETQGHLIEYGAELFNDPDINYLKQYDLSEKHYYMLIARFQQDNNFDMILDGYVQSKSNKPFIVVGGYNNKFGKYLLKKYNAYPQIKFVGGIYDYNFLSSLRWHSKLYFHGHSCGGTNPSLLEAMASNAFIVAHNNPFNRYVLEDDGLYFNNSNEVAVIINNEELSENHIFSFKKNNRKKISERYNWELISQKYLDLCYRVTSIDNK